MTLEEYIRMYQDLGVIDHALRYNTDIDGKPSFYIHPANTDGVTIDYIVDGNYLFNRIFEKVS